MNFSNNKHRLGAFWSTTACLAVTVVALCYAQVSTNNNKMTSSDLEKRSGLTDVLSLTDAFRKTSDTNDLLKLGMLILEPKFGANAVAGLAGLETQLTEFQITNIVLPALIKGLGTGHPGTRRQCAISLSRNFINFSTEAIPALTVLVEDSTEAVNAAPFAAEALGKIGTPAQVSISSLIKAAERPEIESEGFEDSSVRVRAIEAIGRIGIKSQDIQDRVEKLLSDSNQYLRAASAKTLLRIDSGNVRAVSTISALMKSDEVGLRRFVFQSLEDLNSVPQALLEQLKNALNDPDPEVVASAQSLLKAKPQ